MLIYQHLHPSFGELTIGQIDETIDLVEFYQNDDHL